MSFISDPNAHIGGDILTLEFDDSTVETTEIIENATMMIDYSIP